MFLNQSKKVTYFVDQNGPQEAQEGKDTIILDTIIFSVEVTVMCTVIILHKLNKLKK